MIYLLDTAPWVNSVTISDVIPERIIKLLARDEPKGVASISLLETAILHRIGRLNLEGTLDEFFSAALARDIEILELTPAIAAGTNQLPADFQGDPFDRTIVSTARSLGLTLITCDPAIRDSAIRDSEICAVEFYHFKPARGRARK